MDMGPSNDNLAKGEPYGAKTSVDERHTILERGNKKGVTYDEHNVPRIHHKRDEPRMPLSWLIVHRLCSPETLK